MPRFRVTFRKVVYGDTGQARAICQRIVDVEAGDAEVGAGGRHAAVLRPGKRQRLAQPRRLDGGRASHGASAHRAAAAGRLTVSAGERRTRRTLRQREAPPWPRRGSTHLLQGPRPCPSFVSTPGKGNGPLLPLHLAQKHQGGVSRHGCQFLCTRQNVHFPADSPPPTAPFASRWAMTAASPSSRAASRARPKWAWLSVVACRASAASPACSVVADQNAGPQRSNTLDLRRCHLPSMDR